MLSLQQIMQRVAQGMTKQEAADLLAKQVAEVVALGDDAEAATRLIRLNIGYFAGYYTHEIADRAYDLFETQHPIWGREHPNPETILHLGIEYGRRSRERSKLN